MWDFVTTIIFPQKFISDLLDRAKTLWILRFALPWTTPSLPPPQTHSTGLLFVVAAGFSVAPRDAEYGRNKQKIE